MTPDQIRWLTWGAIQHRPHGAPKWDEPGTAKAIADHCGTWGLEVATEHVLAHARDPKAKTPFAIKGNAPHTSPTKAARQPAKAGADECPMHPGEYASSCRACAADHLAGDQASQPHRQKPPAEVSMRGAAACRAAMGITRDDEQAANTELVERLRANERERAHTRPAPDLEPPKHFTPADINHDRVRAAMARRTEGSTT